MKTLIDYINKQDNLYKLSGMITGSIMVVLFIIMQIITFASLLSKTNLLEKMEVRELVKLDFIPEIKEKPPEIIKAKQQKIKSKKSNKQKTKRKNIPKADATPNIVSLVKDFNIKDLVSKKKGSTSRKKANDLSSASAGVKTNTKRQTRTVANYDFGGSLSGQTSYGPAKRRATTGGNQGPNVQLGGSSNFGTGAESGGVSVSGKGGRRTTRGTGGGTGGVKIGLPVATGGDDASIDLHALIKWMKAHPGTIPHLVAHDMGHRTDDLSSAVTFSINGRNYTLFLSCNEIELLLRICLVESNEFMLLKDNGIKEESNFLTIGNVVRKRGQIQSLISSRRAPGARATSFYQIFWSWWQKQQ